MLCLWGNSLHAQAWVWAEEINDTGTEAGFGVTISPVDSSIYVVGLFDNQIPAFGYTTAGGEDMVLVHYFRDGTVDWAFQVGGPGSEFPLEIECDVNGDVYVTGSFSGTVDFGGTSGTLNMTANGPGLDFFLVKYSATGRSLWGVTGGGTANDEGLGLAIWDDLVYAGGYIGGSADFNSGGTTLVTVGSTDAFVAQYDTTGAFNWVRSAPSVGIEETTGVTADAAGVYISGFFLGPSIDFQNTGPGISLTNVGSGSSDIFVAHMRELDGDVVWAERAGGASSDQAQDVVANASGVYVVGGFRSTAIFPGAGTVTSLGGGDFFVARYDLVGGGATWVVRGGNIPGEDVASAIDCDEDGMLYVTGTYVDTLILGNDTLEPAGSVDIFLAALDPLGNYVWGASAASGNADISRSVSSSLGQTYITGSWFMDPIRFAPDGSIVLANTANSWDMFTSRYGNPDVSPVAVDDSVMIFTNGNVTYPVQGNDTTFPGLPLTTTISCAATKGAASVVNDSINYVPGAGFSGLDSVCYSICNNVGLCDTAVLYIRVIPELAPVNPSANIQPVDSGALIIAMDNVNQSNGSTFNTLAYGLANELLHANIPLRWCITAGKPRNGIDISTQAEREFPSPGPPGLFDFRGGPLVIDSVYADSARRVIADFISAQGNVSVYRLLQNISIDERFLLTHQPQIAILTNGGNSAIHRDYLQDAGFATAYFVEVLASAVTLDSTSCYTYISDPDWSSRDLNDSMETRRVELFVESGGNFLAQGEAIGTFEYLEKFQTTGITASAPFSNPNYRNPDMPFLQIQGGVFNGTGSFPSYRLFMDKNFQVGTYSLIQSGNLARFRATARKVGMRPQGGMVYYLGGFDFQNNTQGRVNGRRMYLNTILVPPDRPAMCNLDFSCDVELQKLVLPGPYCMGDTVTYMLVVDNLGPGIAQDVTVVDSLPAGLTALPATPTLGSFDPNTGIWVLGSQLQRQSDTLIFRAVVDTSSATLTNTATVSASIYSVETNLINNQASATINVSAQPAPTINAIPDQCLNNPPVNLLSAPSGGTWSGIRVTGSQFTPDTVGTFEIVYSLTNTAGCTGTDTANVLVNPLPTVDLGADTTLCTGDSTQFDAGNPGATYLWSNTATSQAIWAQTAGQYYVDVTDANTCTNSDTVNLSLLPTYSVDLGPDTSICAGDSLLLDAMNGGATYLWNTGETTQTLQIDSAGTYNVLVGDTALCGDWDEITLQLDALPVVALGNDTTICAGDSVLLDAFNPNSTYLWSTTETTSSIWANAAGQFYVDVTDLNNCEASDT
ncbi:MAG: Ig-like domain-containing protein, partial [Bacteroidota bacterium]